MANLISFLIITCLSCNKSDLERGRQKMTSFVCRLTWWYNPSLSVLWPSFKPSEIKWTKSINKKSFLYRCFSLHLGQIWTLRQLVAIHQGIFPLYWSWHTGNGSLNLLGLHHARLSGPPWRPKHHIVFIRSIVCRSERDRLVNYSFGPKSIVKLFLLV